MMLDGVGPATSLGPAEDEDAAAVLDDVDPTPLLPLCSREEYEELVEGMVADSAPRLFAVVQEYGDRVDGWVEAWGLAFEDHADVMGVEGGLWMGLRSPERAVILFTHRPHVTARVMWVNPASATPAEGDEAA